MAAIALSAVGIPSIVVSKQQWRRNVFTYSVEKWEAAGGIGQSLALLTKLDSSPVESCLLYSSFERRRRKKNVRVAATREDETEPVEVPPKRWTLEQLDEQLKILSNRDISQRIPGNLAERNKREDGSTPPLPPSPLQWPNLDAGFFVFAAIMLFAITIFNNVLYKIFLGPPVVDRRQPSTSSKVVKPGYRLKSSQEKRVIIERQALEAATRDAIDQSRVAPPLTNK